MADRLRHNSKNILRKLGKILKHLFSFFYYLPGIFPAIKVNWCRRAIVFYDQFGFKFWQYPGDEVLLNYKRKAVADSTGVIHFLNGYIKPGFICIDIGAYIAGISVPMWSKAGLQGKVISVEADSAKIERLKSNLELNGFPSDFVVNAAISDREETRSFRCYPKSAGWNTFGNPEFAKDYNSFLTVVQCIDFGQLLQANKLEHVDIVKIDTEGAELLVLKGMHSSLIQKQIGCVIFEVNPLMLPGMGVSVKELISFWDDLPYTLYLLKDNGNISPLSENWPNSFVGDCVAIIKKHNT